MQFKYPELLYALLLLIIPIIIHLFQLRRFEKVAFTNVQLLKNITIQTRKSSQIKKWLILATRMLLLACIIVAFAQPYQAKKTAFNTKNEIVIFLDNSFSMQAKGENGTLLNTAIQDIMAQLDDQTNISIFTYAHQYQNTSIKAIKNDLIDLSFSPNQMDYDAMILKGENTFSNEEGVIRNFVIISDFQQKNKQVTLKNDSLITYRLVQLKPLKIDNISIDSLYISKSTAENLELTVLLSNQGAAIENLPVSLFQDEQLVSKSAVAIATSAETVFTIPNNKSFKGKITIDDAHLNYDNTFYFNIDNRQTIKVLAINDSDAEFIKKLYTADEFDLSLVNINQLNYSTINDQNLIIFNQLKSIPNGLVTAIQSFTEDGGSALIIPSNESDLKSYNPLLTSLNLPLFNSKTALEKQITKINFSHPLLSDVFDKRVENFQYPKVNTFYNFSTMLGTPVLSYEDNSPFLLQAENTYIFSAALNDDNSNFKYSPLIVPVLYNIGKQSIKLPRLYYTVGNSNTIGVSTRLKQDGILKLEQGASSIIPQQKTYSRKVVITTDEFPNASGIFKVKYKDSIIQHLSYNYDRSESNLTYMNLSSVKNSTKNSSVASALADIKSMTNVNELWKWFVIFAMAFLIIEMLILKFLK